MKPAGSITRLTRRRHVGGSRRGQRGDAMIESLVGAVLASIVGLGLSYTTAQMMVSQRYVATQNAVIGQMAGSLAVTGVPNLCAGSSQASVQVGTTSVTLPIPTCATAQVNVSLPGNSQPASLPVGVVTSMSLSTPSSNSGATNLVGGNGVVTISE